MGRSLINIDNSPIIFGIECRAPPSTGRGGDGGRGLGIGQLGGGQKQKKKKGAGSTTLAKRKFSSVSCNRLDEQDRYPLLQLNPFAITPASTNSQVQEVQHSAGGPSRSDTLKVMKVLPHLFNCPGVHLVSFMFSTSNLSSESSSAFQVFSVRLCDPSPAE